MLARRSFVAVPLAFEESYMDRQRVEVMCRKRETRKGVAEVD